MNDVFAGYACIFNEVDLGNDVVLPSAFAQTMNDKMPQNISMLWQHDPNQPIGRWEEFRIDDKGLFVMGRLSTKSSHARDVAFMIEDKVIDGLSIGFKTRRAVQKTKQNTRYIYDLDLWEISVVTFPMQPSARITRLNSAITRPTASTEQRMAQAAAELRA